MARRAHLEVAEHAMRASAGRDGRGKLHRIELETAGNDHSGRICAQLDHALRRLFTLHAESIDVRQHFLEEEAGAAVPPVRSRREAAVDERGLHTSPAAFTQQVRPHFCFHHHEQPRPHERQRAADDELEIEGKEKDPVHLLKMRTRHLLPGHRRRRYEQAKSWIACTQVGYERARRQHFADRDGMNPDGVVGIQVERQRQIAEPLRQAADVLPVPDCLIQKVRRRQHEDRENRDGVQDVH
jgi:hypothetical protein